MFCFFVDYVALGISRNTEIHVTARLLYLVEGYIGFVLSSFCSSFPIFEDKLTMCFRLFERGTAAVGLDFLAHPIWDAYLQYEQRMSVDDPNQDSTPPALLILDRIIHIPLHQYARYFEAYTNVCRSRPLHEFVDEDLLQSFRAELPQEVFGNPAAEERALRERVHLYHMEIYQKTQNEVTKRWQFESEIKRPYFHVKELDGSQLTNWRRYLEFEEAEGNFERTKFLYERCLVACVCSLFH